MIEKAGDVIYLMMPILLNTKKAGGDIEVELELNESKLENISLRKEW